MPFCGQTGLMIENTPPRQVLAKKGKRPAAACGRRRRAHRHFEIADRQTELHRFALPKSRQPHSRIRPTPVMQVFNQKLSEKYQRRSESVLKTIPATCYAVFSGNEFSHSPHGTRNPIMRFRVTYLYLRVDGVVGTCLEARQPARRRWPLLVRAGGSAPTSDSIALLAGGCSSPSGAMRHARKIWRRRVFPKSPTPDCDLTVHPLLTR